MPDVAVIFGGPSPEHDVSVLTGLQAARGLALGIRGSSGRRCGPSSGRRPVTGTRWTPDWRPKPSWRACPGARPVCSWSPAPDGGFTEPGGRLGRARAHRHRCRPGVLPRRTGRGRDPAGRPGPGRHPLLGPDGGRCGPRDGQAGLRRAGGRGRAPHPAPGPAGPTAPSPPPSTGPTSSSPGSAARPSASTWSRTSPPPRPDCRANPHLRLRGRARAVPSRPHRPPGGRAHLAARWSSRRSSARSGPSGADRHPRLPRQVRGRRGHGRRQSRAPGPDPAGAGEGAPRRRRARSPALAAVRGVARIDFLSDGAGVRGQRDQHHSRVRWPATCGWHRRCRSPPCSTTCSTEARQRPTHAYSAAGADGTVLRSAGSIAGKLG